MFHFTIIIEATTSNLRKPFLSINVYAKIKKFMFATSKLENFEYQ